MICVPTRNYDDSFVRKYGQVNGNPGNFYFDYEPPANAVRLRDLAGNLVRKNAEKTVALNEFFVDLFTKTGDLVIDMFAGTASMAMACAKLTRVYCGAEIDTEVHAAATTRLLKFCSALERGDGDAMIAPGVPECLLMQVIVQFVILVWHFVHFICGGIFCFCILAFFNMSRWKREGSIGCFVVCR